MRYLFHLFVPFPELTGKGTRSTCRKPGLPVLQKGTEEGCGILLSMFLLNQVCGGAEQQGCFLFRLCSMSQRRASSLAVTCARSQYYLTVTATQTGIFLIYHVQFAQLALRTCGHPLLAACSCTRNPVVSKSGRQETKPFLQYPR